MCGTCGCGEDVRIDGQKHATHHHHPSGHGAEGSAREIDLELDILAKNDAYAAKNRRRFMESDILALNLVSSPGSGKTSLLVKTIELLGDTLTPYVVEGDQQTSHDADRIRETGATAIQINTGKGCHLDAHMVGHAVAEMAPANGSAVFIENVGNLVCPAGFDLGEAHKVVVLSVTEGDDKPLKYPDIFAAADLALINKIDLLPHVDFDIDRVTANARQINPRIEILRVSARTGDGMPAWIEWIKSAHSHVSRLEAAE